MFILDPTHPLTLEQLRRVFTEYRNWGVRYYMIDFLNAIGGSTPGTFRPSTYADADIIPRPAPYRKALKVIREAAGPDTFLLSSTGPTFWNIGLFDGIRAGSDYGEGRPLDGPGKGFWPGTFVINKPTHWTSHRTATDALASHAFLHRKLFWSDAGNVLTVGQPVPLQDAQISTTIFGLSGGQIMLGDEISQLPPERLRLLRLVFPRSPESARAIDLFTSVDPDYPKFFHLPVRTAWDEWDLYAIFNYGPEPLTRSIPRSEAFNRLGLLERTLPRSREQRATYHGSARIGPTDPSVTTPRASMGHWDELERTSRSSRDYDLHVERIGKSTRHHVSRLSPTGGRDFRSCPRWMVGCEPQRSCDREGRQ